MTSGFRGLPAELRVMIYEAVDEEEEGIVEVAFTRTPTYEKARKGKPARVLWKYRCFERAPSPLLSISAESRAEYIRTHPQFLQLNQGPKVYFKATTDTVYFDASSMAALWFYMTEHVPDFRRRTPDTQRLKGFEQIQIFGSYHPHPAAVGAPAGSTANRIGLRDIRAGNVNGLTTIRLLDDRNIRPTFRGVSPGPILQEMKLEVHDQLADLRNATTRGSLRYTTAQRNAITNIDGDVNRDFNNFDMLVALALNIPEVP